MEIDEKMAGPVLVLARAGRLDSNTAPDLEQALPTRIGQHPATIVDLSQVGYVSSAGLRILLKGAKTARSSGHRLVLSGLVPSVREVFDISGFNRLIAIESSRDAPLASTA